MAFFSVNHLLDYELDYELAVRCVETVRNVTDKRKMLTKLLRKERNANDPGSQVHFEEYDYDFRTEEAAINKSILSITDLIIDFEGTESDSSYTRVKSRLIQLTGNPNPLRLSSHSLGTKVVCSDHFEKDCYLAEQSKLLRLDASPNRFDCHKSPNDHLKILTPKRTYAIKRKINLDLEDLPNRRKLFHEESDVVSPSRCSITTSPIQQWSVEPLSI
ncbi:unnamed protein product [Ceutorhynchus assimilis]|uniref:Uncharacterized protein n=1 Tax=Ceutorhynchus assimilis TaxID=467358 RepID=A0A9P0DYT4_9CUCU|nr:unnamed protein product [Ceutorhynchus assimilis]